MKFIVYIATNKVNNKSYIGCTSISLKRRKIQHKSEARKPRYYFHYAIKKYGFNKFGFEILWKAKDAEEMYNMEAEFIQHYKTNDPNLGYNLSNGGEGNSSRVGRRHENHPMAKLTWDRVKNLRDDYATGEFNQVDLAKKYGITKTTIWMVLQNRQWLNSDYKYIKQKRIGGYRGKIHS